MSKTIEIDDDGFVDIKFKDISKVLDLYEVNNHLVDLRSVTDEEPEESSFVHKVIDYLVSLGFPKVSTRAATLFVNNIFSTVDELKKKDELVQPPSTNADSQNSTDSPSSD